MGSEQEQKMSRLNQCLQQFLNSGFRDDLRWNAEEQRLVAEAIFECISQDAEHLHLIKGSPARMLEALVCVLKNTHEAAVFQTATNGLLTLTTVFPSTLKDGTLAFVSLLSPERTDWVSPAAAALRAIILKLDKGEENLLCGLLLDQEVISCIGLCIRNYRAAAYPFEYILVLADLLCQILCKWTQFCYPVSKNALLLESLAFIRESPDLLVKSSIIEVYSSIALCSHGAAQLLQNGEALLQGMALCMGRSSPIPLRIQAFKLAERLASDENVCLRMMNLCGKAVVEGIVEAMRGFRADLNLAKEACGLVASITGWAGPHHRLLWDKGIDEVLISILMERVSEEVHPHLMSVEQLINASLYGLKPNNFLGLRPQIWNIVSGLATHCTVDLRARWNGLDVKLDLVITCACICFLQSILTGNQDAFGRATESRAVLRCIQSPNQYIMAKSTVILTKLLTFSRKRTAMGRLVRLMESQQTFHQSVANLISVACFCRLPKQKSLLVKHRVHTLLMRWIKWLVTHHVHLGVTSVDCCSRHKTGLCRTEALLHGALRAFYKIANPCSKSKRLELFAGPAVYDEAQFMNSLCQICTGSFSPGTKMYAALLLNEFGAYGFPSKLGGCLSKVFMSMEYTDTELRLSNGDSVRVHGAVVFARCPSLLDERIPFNKESLGKFLEFLYSGYCCPGDEMVKKVRDLARRFKVEPLLVEGKAIPRFDLRPALSAPGYRFSDIILEAGGTELASWRCSLCSQVSPYAHVHVHKVVLVSRCDYLHTMYNSGMQESTSKILKLPLSWQAMSKLVHWFYTDDLPVLLLDCLWDNMLYEEKITQLLPYIELYWLADVWMLQEVQGLSNQVIMGCLKSDKRLCAQVIRAASGLSLTNLLDAATKMQNEE